jgi:pyrroloquinoline quinone biosynthesis protein B
LFQGLEAAIRVLLLGVAAGGGLPQWNCACANCQQARRGVIRPQTQSSVAIGDERGHWFLVNASPDLSAQILAHPDLGPQPGSSRNSPIAGVFLSSADVDHVTGLLSLREGNALRIYATPAIQQAASILVDPVLQSFCGVAWGLPRQGEGLQGPDGGETSLKARVILLPGHAPRYAPNDSKGDYTAAWQFLDERTGGRLLVAPGVSELTGPLEDAAKESDAVLLDGTFWRQDELSDIRPGAPKAWEMGHKPIKDGTLPFLASLPGRRIYIHINNTNPIFDPASPERAAVEAAGVAVGHDGMTFDL